MDTQHGEMFEKDEMWGGKCCRKHMGVRALTAVIVAIFIFWCGFQFGEIRASMGGYGYGYGFGARMMQNAWGSTSSIPSPTGAFAQ